MQALLDFLAIKHLISFDGCLNWNPLLVWLHIASDVIIVPTCYLIALSLAYYVQRRKKDLPYPGLYLMFALFVFASATTQLLSIVSLWIPLYWLAAYTKVFSAMLAIATAVFILRVLPRALKIPGETQLQAEIEQRKLIEDALRHSEIKFRTLYNNTSDAMIIQDEQGFNDCNPACLSMFGFDDKELFLTRHPSDFSPAQQACGSDSITLANQHIAKALATGHHRFDWLYKRVDTDTVFPVEVILNAVDIDGKWMIHTVVRDISERSQTEERVRKSENQFRTLIENLRVGITLHDTQAKVLLHNPYALELLDLSSEQLLNKTISGTGLDIYHEDGSVFLTNTLPVVQAITTRRAVQNVVMSLFRPTKKDKVWLLVTATPQFNDDGSLLQVICTFIDITRRKEAEQRLKQSESYFRNTFQHAPIGVATISLNGRFLEVNQTVCNMLGYNHDELIGMSYRQLVQTKDRRFHFNYIQQLLPEGICSFSVEKQYICKDNHLIWGSLSARRVRCLASGSDYIIATLENIDERKRVEINMFATRNQLQATLNAIPDLLLELGLDGYCYDIYTKCNDLLNMPSEQLIGRNISDFMPAEACEVILSALSEANANGQSHGKQLRIVLPGSDFWAELSVAQKQGATDQPHFVVLSINITQRKQVELQLRQNEERFNLSQEYGGIGTWESDLINNRQFWSKATYQLVRLPATYNASWEDFVSWIHPDDRQQVLDANQDHLIQGKKYDVEYRILLKDGQTRWMRSVGKAEFNAEGIATRFIGIAQDITERKLMEAEIKRSNEDLEQFAYAISHDMRQPLRMVSSYLTLIENALSQQLDDELQQFFNFAIEGAKRMDAMILSLLDYSRVGRKNTAVHPVSSRAALDEALRFLEPELQSSGGSVEIFGDWIDIAVHGDELTRLLQNLIENALKYHPKDQPPRVEVSALSNGTVFKVGVRDQGIGIDSQYIDQLFKVFFRLHNHSQFEGAGVGLALCRKIVEFYGGKIGVESVGDGQGSVFWFELPILPVSLESKQ